MHYWLHKFVQRMHNITTSKKQLYRLVNTLLNLPQTCAEKLSFAVVQKRVDTEISLKLCALLVLQVCAWPAQHHNKQKTTLQACKHLAKFAANLCRKDEFCRSTKEGRNFEISLKLCALLVLQVCAKGAQHHNQQKTTLQACKHLTKFAANLCRKVEFCRSTKEGRHLNIIEIMCIIGSTSLCKGCTTSQQAKNNSTGL